MGPLFSSAVPILGLPVLFIFFVFLVIWQSIISYLSILILAKAVHFVIKCPVMSTYLCGIISHVVLEQLGALDWEPDYITVHLIAFVITTSSMVLGTHGVLNKCLLIHEQTKGSVIEVVNTGKKKGPNNEPDFFFFALS